MYQKKNDLNELLHLSSGRELCPLFSEFPLLQKEMKVSTSAQSHGTGIPGVCGSFTAQVHFTVGVETLNGLTLSFFYFFKAFQNTDKLLFVVVTRGSRAGISGQTMKACQLWERNNAVS